MWDENGQSVQRPLSSLDVEDRQRLFVEGDGGLEPLWLWLSQDGRPFQPHSWEAVYRAASGRCRKVLEGKVAEPPYFTPHMARHSFALKMLVALMHALDKRFGLTPEERVALGAKLGDRHRAPPAEAEAAFGVFCRRAKNSPLITAPSPSGPSPRPSRPRSAAEAGRACSCGAGPRALPELVQHLAAARGGAELGSRAAASWVACGG
ncbi:hypothetical protein OG612_43365 (plasmid) [Streptomyces sp. NBC_01527]|uniref:hypothetical protein n=1 Tax=unclassified Streptomyces TaxID=2593676 RepID=UPI0032440D46